MKTYKLYLESGPKKRKTMVHVPELLGCIANGPTTDQALDSTPQAVRDFLELMARCGEPVNLQAPFQTEIAQHVTEGIWLGNGDPSILFETDLVPVSREEIEVFIKRLEAMAEEVERLVLPLPAETFSAPPSKGRSLEAILEHVLEAEYSYMYAFGKLEGLPGLGSIVQKRDGHILDWLAHVREQEFARLRALDLRERSEPFIHWKYTRTARKVIRRMLEHQWEHLVEIKVRLAEMA